MKQKIALVLVAMALAGTAFAQAKPEDQIKWRQSGYTFMAWNMGKLKGMLIENPSSFNKDQAAAAANAIAAISNSGMGALYASGTDKGKGWVETRVKPEFFQKPDDVKQVAVAFNKEANELAKVAAGGDAAALKAQFDKVGQSCKACHDKFRKDEK